MIKRLQPLSFLILFTLLLSFVSAPAFAQPRGAVKLATDKRFTVDSISCGKIGSRWLAGTLLNRNRFFISDIQQNKNFKAGAEKAPGRKKKNLLKKVYQFFSDFTRINRSLDKRCLLSVNIQHAVCLCKYFNDDPRRIRKYLLIYCGLTLSYIRQP